MLSQYAGEQHALSRVLPDGVMQRSFAVAVLFWLIYLYPHIHARARDGRQQHQSAESAGEEAKAQAAYGSRSPSRAVHLVKFVLLLRLLLLPAQLGGR